MTDEDAAERLRLTCVEGTERLIDALDENGFRALEDAAVTWRGLLRLTPPEADGNEVCTAVDVTIPIDYPYTQPSVSPLSRTSAETWTGRPLPVYHEGSRSWHQERTGNLCLFEDADHTRLPWADPAALLDQVQSWLQEDRAGWPDDPPALDLERYLVRTGEVLLYEEGELCALVGRVVQLSRMGTTWTVGHPAKVPIGRRGVRGTWKGSVALVLEAGELSRPVRDWASLRQAVDDDGERLDREVRYGVREVVLMYSRGGAQGVLALRLGPGDPPSTVQAHLAAPQDGPALTRRAHPEHDALATHRVTVVGVGAIGSVLADLLHRSGVGHLHLVDTDVVLPGNLARHLVGRDHVGIGKAQAVSNTLQAARPKSITELTTSTDRVSSLDAARSLLESCDVLVDASADSTASRLIAAAARAGVGRAVSVCVLADGYAVRVDHWPEPVSGGLPETPLPAPRPGAYETGCSSPVSTTPPAAAWEAAAVGARHVIAVLLDGAQVAGEQRVLRDEAGVP